MSNIKTLLSRIEMQERHIKQLEEENQKHLENEAKLASLRKTDVDLTRDFCVRILSGSHEISDDKKAAEWDRLPLPKLLMRTQAALEAKESNWASHAKQVMKRAEQYRDERDAARKERDEAQKETAMSPEELLNGESLPEEKAPKPAKKGGTKILNVGNDAPLVPSEILNNPNLNMKEALIRGNNIQIAEDERRDIKKQYGKEKVKKLSKEEMNKWNDMLTDIAWLVIRVIGLYGVSVYNDIAHKVMEQDATITEYKIRSQVGLLKEHKVLLPGVAKTGFKRAFNVFKLTGLGMSLYIGKYKVIPKKSEWEKLVAEHTSLSHGYGIKILAQVLQQSGNFKSVEIYHRNNPVLVEKTSKYIPDIVCTNNDGKTMYIEYELHNEEKSEPQYFSGKMNRYVGAVKGNGGKINFVVTNGEEADALWGRIRKWLDGKQKSALEGITIRVTTTEHTKSSRDLWENSGWKYFMQPSVSDKIITNF